MAIPPDLGRHAREQRQATQQLIAGLIALARRLWRLIDPLAIVESWLRLLVELVGALIAVQTQAASTAQAYVTGALTLQGATPDPAGRLVPAAFAGTAADGRPLESLLAVPARAAVGLIGEGMPAEQALQTARQRLERIITTEVTDAARTAVGVAQVADRSVAGYLRMVVLPSCARCIILSGRWYRSSSGFQRHPLCDCVHVPGSGPLRRETDPPKPEAIFKDMSRAEQDRAFTKAGARAIRDDAADIRQIVNARRGMASAGVFGRRALVTTEGTTRRGLAGRRLGREGGFRRVPGERVRRAVPVRLMPEQIYADAARLGYDRRRTMDLLRLHGYVILDLREVDTAAATSS